MNRAELVESLDKSAARLVELYRNAGIVSVFVRGDDADIGCQLIALKTPLVRTLLDDAVRMLKNGEVLGS